MDAEEDVHVSGVTRQQVPPPVQLSEGREVQSSHRVERLRASTRVCGLRGPQAVPQAGDLRTEVIVNVPQYESKGVSEISENSFVGIDCPDSENNTLKM